MHNLLTDQQIQRQRNLQILAAFLFLSFCLRSLSFYASGAALGSVTVVHYASDLIMGPVGDVTALLEICRAVKLCSDCELGHVA